MHVITSYPPVQGRQQCPTRIRMAGLPTDLVSWPEAEVAVALTPYPMSQRDLKRKYKADPRRRTFRFPGVRGERVSRSDVLRFHRDLYRGWLSAAA